MVSAGTDDCERFSVKNKRFPKVTKFESADNLEDNFALEPALEDFGSESEDVHPSNAKLTVKCQKTAPEQNNYNSRKGGEGEIKKKKKKPKFKRRKITEDLSIINSTTLSKSDSFIAVYQKFLVDQNLSSIETDELKMEQSFFSDVTDRTKETRIEDFLTTGLHWSPRFCQPRIKSAYIVIVCSAAMRCIELINSLRRSETQSKAHVSKMFSSHMKISDQAAELNKSLVHICVGTPARLTKLVEEKHLALDWCKYLIIDYNWRNSKWKRIVDIPETNVELMKFVFLFRKGFNEAKNSIAIF
ncbi:protein CMSS1-like [Convolutriloba macropyga]|uniref:protein CMSS1-like n=1 Tax=Convolutriloba macropyga TaxID=536237 RepID=UPI003F52335E